MKRRAPDQKQIDAHFRAKALEDLAALPGYWYCASPYTAYAWGREAAFVDICSVTAAIMKRGVKAFSPIAHSHPICQYGAVDEVDLDFWLKQDQPLIDAATGLLVVTLHGWQQSKGTMFELGEFEKAGKPWYFLDPLTLRLT